MRDDLLVLCRRDVVCICGLPGIDGLEEPGYTEAVTEEVDGEAWL